MCHESPGEGPAPGMRAHQAASNAITGACLDVALSEDP